jgi:hypothetical protein
MPRGIAAHWARSATPTCKPTIGSEKRRFRGGGDDGGDTAVQLMVRYWDANPDGGEPSP